MNISPAVWRDFFYIRDAAVFMISPDGIHDDAPVGAGGLCTYSWGDIMMGIHTGES